MSNSSNTSTNDKVNIELIYYDHDSLMLISSEITYHNSTSSVRQLELRTNYVTTSSCSFFNNHRL